MPPKGWRKKDQSKLVPDAEELRSVPDAVEAPADLPEATDDEPESPPSPPPKSSTEPEKASPVDDEEAEFVNAKDVKETAPAFSKSVGESGFIAELVAGAGQKLHEVEYTATGDSVFIHTPADERIWQALGHYVESTLDPTKYGIIVLMVVLMGSETAKLAIYGKHRSDAAAKMNKAKGKP